MFSNYKLVTPSTWRRDGAKYSPLNVLWKLKTIKDTNWIVNLYLKPTLNSNSTIKTLRNNTSNGKMKIEKSTKFGHPHTAQKLSETISNDHAGKRHLHQSIGPTYSTHLACHAQTINFGCPKISQKTRFIAYLPLGPPEFAKRLPEREWFAPNYRLSKRICTFRENRRRTDEKLHYRVGKSIAKSPSIWYESASITLYKLFFIRLSWMH